VSLDALFQIICDADIKGVVSTAVAVAIVHAEDHRGASVGCPSASSGQNFCKTKILEAGGVEPPSEKPCNQKTTCLARSVRFADCAQSGQETQPTSPMVSPTHYGPKRAGQPTV
jgi:hypothetical protein